MGFRERPEYQGWRDAVFRLFGQKCIRCGYTGNIHAHHVMPVEDYPELAFEPTNGVPLCGNCHVALKGNELAHADELKRLQRAASGGTPVAGAADTSNGDALRERAYAEPSNEEAVMAWLTGPTDPKSVVEFWDAHGSGLSSSYQVRFRILEHLFAVGRWRDVITEAENASRLLSAELTAFRSRLAPVSALPEAVRAAGKDRIAVLEAQADALSSRLEPLHAQLANAKGAALYELGQYAEALLFLREAAVRFPNSADVYTSFITALYKVYKQTRGCP